MPEYQPIDPSVIGSSAEKFAEKIPHKQKVHDDIFTRFTQETQEPSDYQELMSLHTQDADSRAGHPSDVYIPGVGWKSPQWFKESLAILSDPRLVEAICQGDLKRKTAARLALVPEPQRTKKLCRLISFAQAKKQRAEPDAQNKNAPLILTASHLPLTSYLPLTQDAKTPAQIETVAAVTEPEAVVIAGSTTMTGHKVKFEIKIDLGEVHLEQSEKKQLAYEIWLQLRQWAELFNQELRRENVEEEVAPMPDPPFKTMTMEFEFDEGLKTASPIEELKRDFMCKTVQSSPCQADDEALTEKTEPKPVGKWAQDAAKLNF